MYNSVLPSTTANSPGRWGEWVFILLPFNSSLSGPPPVLFRSLNRGIKLHACIHVQKNQSHKTERRLFPKTATPCWAHPKKQCHHGLYISLHETESISYYTVESHGSHHLWGRGTLHWWACLGIPTLRLCRPISSFTCLVSWLGTDSPQRSVSVKDWITGSGLLSVMAQTLTCFVILGDNHMRTKCLSPRLPSRVTLPCPSAGLRNLLASEHTSKFWCLS